MAGDIPVPANISECPSGDGILIVCRPNRSVPLPILGILFCLAMVAAGLFGLLSWDGRLLDWKMILPRFLFLLPAFACFGLAYGILATWFNKTAILVSPLEVSIRLRPLPFPGNKTLSREGITQLFVRERSFTDAYGKVTRSHELHWIDRENARRPLVRHLQAHEAIYLERRLEQILGIDDQFVRGAYCG